MQALKLTKLVAWRLLFLVYFVTSKSVPLIYFVTSSSSSVVFLGSSTWCLWQCTDNGLNNGGNILRCQWTCLLPFIASWVGLSLGRGCGGSSRHFLGLYLWSCWRFFAGCGIWGCLLPLLCCLGLQLGSLSSRLKHTQNRCSTFNV